MPSVDVPLAKDAIKKLIGNLKQLSKELRDDVKVDIERATCELVAAEVRDNIGSLTDLDGNYLGGDNPNASVTVEVALVGHEAIWRGAQIAFLEFGTGASGALHPYPGGAMDKAGYHPDPTKAWWVYEDAKYGNVLSRGLIPQAPMFNAAMLLRSAGITQPAVTIVRGAVNRAVTL